MKHFSLTEWADFVRGVVTAEQKTSMQEHLGRDCARCKKTVEMWTSLVEFSRHEALNEPPASALRVAESFLIPLRLALRPRQMLQLAQAVLDSFEGPALQGEP